MSEPKTETHEFQAEVSKLLHLMVHSVYSEKEIFLRELISNSADACDRLRYESLTDENILDGDTEFRIEIEPDADARTLTITDNGIGMSHEELIDNLGTVARSGTAAFVEKLSGDDAKDVSLIGQFGVGFYSAFMVADKVEVITRKAGTADSWRWTSDGMSAFEIEPATPGPRGVKVILHLNTDGEEFLEPLRLRHVIKTYSDHVPIPITIVGGDDEGDTASVNAASALWTRSAADVTEDQYKSFYQDAAKSFDEPWLTLHYHAEGLLDYRVLLFVPSIRPMDLFDPARKNVVKLYVKRIFTTDDCDDLIPSWLRFLRGVIDSDDLPLNLSREMLQHNRVVRNIRTAVTNRVLTELGRKAEDDEESYSTFWENFGPVMKEGIYEDLERKDRILDISRFRSTLPGDDLISLKAYKDAMAENQKAIYYITGDNPETILASPQLEGFRARNIPVLLLTDPVDEFWVTVVEEYDETPLVSITMGAADLDDLAGSEKADEDEGSEADFDMLIATLKLNLGDKVSDVRISNRLTDSPVCLVAEGGGMDMRLQRILAGQGQSLAEIPRVLEINAGHSLIKALASAAEKDGAADSLTDASFLLLDQARLLEGEPISDPAAFASRLSALMEQSLG